jgi:hypothetical protein
MADIVNGKKIDRKKDLYNHVAFSDLYAYNDPISSILDLSKTIISRYIEKGINALNVKGPAVFTRDKLVKIPVDQLRDEEADPENPMEIYFSVMQIIEPYDIGMSDETRSKIFERLMKFITIGLYPLVSAPMSEDSIYDTFEKYDGLTPEREIIGTIVDANMIGKSIYATIMWSIDYANDLNEETLYNKAGELRLRDMTATPVVWKERDSAEVTNFGIPIYEFSPMRMTLAVINHTEGFSDYINEAVVTGNLRLDFVDHMLQQCNQTMSEITKRMIEQPDPEPAEVPDVPVIDARVTNEFGHRMRLYDDPDDFTGVYDDEPII